MSLDQTNVIDALGIEETSGRVILVIRHDAPWDGSAAQLYLLQEKLNAYLSFALDGEMAADYPDLAGRSVGLRIDCAAPPDAAALRLLGPVRRQILFQDITLEVRVSYSGAARDCAGGCSCH
jgi:hypothetical protein